MIKIVLDIQSCIHVRTMEWTDVHKADTKKSNRNKQL